MVPGLQPDGTPDTQSARPTARRAAGRSGRVDGRLRSVICLKYDPRDINKHIGRYNRMKTRCKPIRLRFPTTRQHRRRRRLAAPAADFIASTPRKSSPAARTPFPAARAEGMRSPTTDSPKRKLTSGVESFERPRRRNDDTPASYPPASRSRHLCGGNRHTTPAEKVGKSCAPGDLPSGPRKRNTSSESGRIGHPNNLPKIPAG